MDVLLFVASTIVGSAISAVVTIIVVRLFDKFNKKK